MTPLEQDTLLAVDVACRVEALIRERWNVPGTLAEQIEALRPLKVDNRLLGMMHYLRRERNRLVHHPRQPLRNRDKFEQFARALLPELALMQGPLDMSTNLQALLDRELAALGGEFSLEAEIAREMAELQKLMGQT